MNILSVFENFASKRLLVLGDVMVDSYLRGDVSRVSPEAPVQIINLDSRESRLGGAANVALNLAALGATPVLCGIVGQDGGGNQFMELLSENNLSSEGIVKNSNRKTTIKTRIIGNNQHLLRIDEEENGQISESLEAELIQKVQSLLEKNIDAVIFEDYNKGLLTAKVIGEVIKMAGEKNIVTAVDPKKDNFFEYKNVTLFKPNLKELKEGLNFQFNLANDNEKFERAIEKMEERLNNKISLVTMSERGVFVKDGDDKDYIAAHIRNVADVSGAGDTVISVATLCLSCGMSPKQMAEIANIAGGLVCEYSGVVTIDRELLLKEARKIVMA